ncbi:MAG: metallophosphoesterase family protein [Eubacteriales bacterium]|jgi:Icc-related predicted phosphoesterase|nr:metallophosphoesterase family protein [Eubacteriales bacterium]MDD4105022.1 metallophosphoesterase family protein [Eubacteriales bacterium]MDD4710622.1 metallophosphoesterase family protein [Eubacteriales bacterium]NLO14507.1 metallophosphoesterase [Clostridiales bacterium]
MPSVRALLVADQESAYIWDHFDKSVFENVDVIISCGDLKASYLSFLTTMVAAPLYYVHGNHDGNYLINPPEGCESLEDEMVEINGIRFIGFGGAKSLSPKPFHFSEQEVNRQIIKRIPQICTYGGFDVLVTHAPAAGLGDGDDQFHQGFGSYRMLLNQFQPTYYIHGHQHLNYSGSKRSQQYGNTTIINAYGYQIVTLEVPVVQRKRLSYIKTRYDWGKNNAARV